MCFSSSNGSQFRYLLPFLIGAASLIGATSLISASRAEDWPTWRGANGRGVADDSALPSSWNLEGERSNVRWKVELPGPGNSSPIVSNNRVWITQFDKHTGARQLRCYDAQHGKELWTKAFKSEQDEPTHPTNPHCAASPATDGKHVVAFFGSAGLCCFNQDGDLLWEKKLGSPQHLFGQGASPLIHDDLVTLNYGPGEEQFWVTLDLKTGEEKWRIEISKSDAPNPFDAPDGPKLPPGSKLRDPFGTWATPVMAQRDGRKELILAFPKLMQAVDPETGMSKWTCGELGPQVLSSPFIVDDTLVCLGSTAMGVRLFGEGDVTDTHRLWFEAQDRPRIGTGIAIDQTIIANTMQGIIEGIDVQSGKRLWQKRLSSASGGGSWSSLVRCGERVFATNQDGSIYVFTISPEYKLLATNQLGETTNASPAIAGDCIYIRTDKHLWCIGPA
ncbi:MAG: PQQ-binding-like beta-propeller repeat protein [Planctomycetota bacterium]|nr:PQQ-binding-like beta-propeller repeat protein [Planctomycetota bacterium]